MPLHRRRLRTFLSSTSLAHRGLSFARRQPILFIRALDHNSHAIGGASLSPPSPIDPSLPCAPNEILGEPVSQFHLTALELFSDYNFKKDPFRPPPPNTFLACCENEVRTVEGKGGRQFVGLEEVVVRGDSSEGRKVIKRRTSVPGFASPYGANSDLRKRGKSVSNLSVAVAKEKERPRAWTIECGGASFFRCEVGSELIGLRVQSRACGRWWRSM